MDDGLLGNRAALEFEHGDAEHLGAVRISAGLREGETISLRDADVDLVCHGPAANVVPERVDCGSALHFTRPARRIVAIDDAQDGVVGVETCERRPVASFDGALDGCTGHFIGLGWHGWSPLSAVTWVERAAPQCGWPAARHGGPPVSNLRDWAAAEVRFPSGLRVFSL